MLKNKESGQSMVEFALVLPFLILLVCAIIDFGWIFGNQLLLNNACREAARDCSVNAALTQNQLQTMAQATMADREGTLYSDGSVNVAVTNDAATQEVTVTATCGLKMITPLSSTLFGPTFNISARTIMRAER